MGVIYRKGIPYPDGIFNPTMLPESQEISDEDKLVAVVDGESKLVPKSAIGGGDVDAIAKAVKTRMKVAEISWGKTLTVDDNAGTHYFLIVNGYIYIVWTSDVSNVQIVNPATNSMQNGSNNVATTTLTGYGGVMRVSRNYGTVSHIGITTDKDSTITLFYRATSL